MTTPKALPPKTVPEMAASWMESRTSPVIFAMLVQSWPFATTPWLPPYTFPLMVPFSMERRTSPTICASALASGLPDR